MSDQKQNRLSFGQKGKLFVDKSRKQPSVIVCETGKGMEQLYYPRGVTVDNKTANIYIADANKPVEVFVHIWRH